MCGLPHLDFEDLQAVARYDGGYNQEHPTIKSFWAALQSFNLQEKKLFLKFTTGCDRFRSTTVLLRAPGAPVLSSSVGNCTGPARCLCVHPNISGQRRVEQKLSCHQHKTERCLLHFHPGGQHLKRMCESLLLLRRAPVGGLSNLELMIQRAGPDSEALPTAHTCFNYFLLPEYSDREKLRKKLLTAINNAEGFGLQ